MRISDWSSDVCSSDLSAAVQIRMHLDRLADPHPLDLHLLEVGVDPGVAERHHRHQRRTGRDARTNLHRSEEHTSELQSLMRISYAVFCLKNKKNRQVTHIYTSKKEQSKDIRIKQQKH